MSEQARYLAFVSYSHADREIARWLHGVLESYHLPRKLVGEQTPLGPAPARLGRIFMDREELAASASLSVEINAALDASGALIVVCSPAAAQSRWVNEEIRSFKLIHGATRVFPVIVDGEPFASAKLGREVEECFPPALRFVVDGAGAVTATPAEPIAADLRAGADGRRLATLKLIAGLTGLRLDTLVRREVQRRARRLTAVAVSASVLAIFMAGLSLVALRARNEAERQHEQAEGLIEFMLVDLRKKLEPVGRLEVLDAVGEKALAHYDAQQGEGLDTVSLGHRSRALHLIGEIRQNRGKLGEALAAFERAADTTAQLLKREPTDGQRIFDHAQSVFWVGNVARDRGQRQDAVRAFTQYRSLARQLVSLYPDKREWQIEPGYAASNLGVVMLDEARPKDALGYLDEARAVMTSLLASQPELAFDLAHVYGFMSQANERVGALDQAIEIQKAKQALFSSVPDADKNQQVQRGLQNAEYEIGRLELARGRLDSAKEFAESSLALAEKRTAVDQANMFWLGESVYARLLLAEVTLALGRSGYKASAHDAVMRARRDIVRLLNSDSTKISWHVGLNGAALALAAQTGEGDGAALRAELTAYVVKVRALVAAGKSLQPPQLRAAAQAEFQLGQLLMHSDKYAAADHWRGVVERLAPFQQESNFHLLALLARARLALDDRTTATELAKRIEESAYRHPIYADLVKEMARGKGPEPSPAKRSTT
jgi:tetratricopeptide (TPR) repeat protein